MAIELVGSFHSFFVCLPEGNKKYRYLRHPETKHITTLATWPTLQTWQSSQKWFQMKVEGANFCGFNNQQWWWNQYIYICILVGGFKHCLFSIIYGNNHPNWLIFFRGVETTNQYIYIYIICTWVCLKTVKDTQQCAANYREKDWPLDLGVATHT